jgi:aspartyl-tRNA(Asn)/glutamyl-tRNA(Gln) amidotransferase subunit A
MILPASGSIAPKFDEEMDRMSERYLILENHMAIGNFGGFPSITIPNGLVNNMPIGIKITGPQFKDGETLDIANKIEEELGYKGLIKEEYDV